MADKTAEQLEWEKHLGTAISHKRGLKGMFGIES